MVDSLTNSMNYIHIFPHDYQRIISSCSEMASAWDEVACTSIESHIDHMEDSPIITTSTTSTIGLDRATLQRFLQIRLYTSKATDLSAREARLAHYLLTVDDRSGGMYPYPDGLRALALRQEELPLGEKSCTYIDTLADRLPALARDYATSIFERRYDAVKQGGYATLRSLGVAPPLVEDCMPFSAPLVSWDVRRWRGEVLSDYIDGFEHATFFPDVRPHVHGGGSLAMGRMAGLHELSNFLWVYTAKSMLMARSISRRMRQQTLPADPYSRSHDRLKTFTIDGLRTIYSVGYDHIDNGGDNNGDLVLYSELVVGR